MSAITPEFGCTIACRCGHEADMGQFLFSRLGIELPRGRYQCRSCGRAWEMRSKGNGRHLSGGLYIPPDVEAVEVEALL